MVLSQKSTCGRILTIIMNRPQVHNAFDEYFIAELKEAFLAAIEDPDVRILVLAGEGKSFSAGADLNWMRRVSNYTFEENIADAEELGSLLHLIYTSPKPVIARVHGSAFGGGVGLVAVCDIAISVEEATFCLSEVRLGLIPSVISPYVIRRMGSSQFRVFALTGVQMTSVEAFKLGLVHKLVMDEEELDAVVEVTISALLKGSPQAQRDIKDLSRFVSESPLNESVRIETAIRIAAARGSAEGKEGIQAFLEKRRPSWVREDD